MNGHDFGALAARGLIAVFIAGMLAAAALGGLVWLIAYVVRHLSWT